MSNKQKILVVEDDNDSRETLTYMLEGLGYSVVAFASGTEALKDTESLEFDLALLDIMMPGMNGYEVMNALKANPKFSALPIIFVTAKDQDSEVIEGYQGGADYYITKPFHWKRCATCRAQVESLCIQSNVICILSLIIVIQSLL